uniref:Uncharacterized protein n=1 Tax=viral metagenome TaxID=1070528 RepID=A0A6C0BP18_9ZZZZ
MLVLLFNIRGQQTWKKLEQRWNSDTTVNFQVTDLKCTWNWYEHTLEVWEPNNEEPTKLYEDLEHHIQESLKEKLPASEYKASVGLALRRLADLAKPQRIYHRRHLNAHYHQVHMQTLHLRNSGHIECILIN